MNQRLLTWRAVRPILVTAALALATSMALAQLRAPGQGGAPSLRLPGSPPPPPETPAAPPEREGSAAPSGPAAPAVPPASPGSSRPSGLAAPARPPEPSAPSLRLPSSPPSLSPAPSTSGAGSTSTTGSSQPIREVDRVVAVVNKDVITLLELERRVEIVSQQLSRRGGELPPPDVLRRQLLERLIVDRAQLQLAREYGLRVDDQQLDRAIANIAQENKLTLPQLREQLASEGQSFARFREDIRGEILRARLREREVDSKVQVSEADIDAFLAAQGQPPKGETAAGSGTEYRVAQILLRVPEGATPEQIEGQRKRGEELRKQLEDGGSFERLAAAFSDAPEALNGGLLEWRTADRLPELFERTVTPMKVGEVSPLVRSAAGFHLLQLADKRQGGGASASAGKGMQMAPVTQTHARHILIRPNELVSEDEAFRRLREIRERVMGGTADFGEMARQYSSDGSAGRGGDLGWIYPGDTVPEFEGAMNAMKPGEIGEPVRTPFGVHLIQVLERRTDEASPERVRQRAREVLRARRSEERYEDWLRQLRDSTYVEYKLEGN